MKEGSELYITTTQPPMMNCLRKMGPSVFIIGIFNQSRLKCLKWKMTFVELMKWLFNTTYNPSNGQTRFVIPPVKSEYIGKLSLRFRYFGPVAWEIILPDVYKNINTLPSFKNQIKKWVPSSCICRLCTKQIGSLPDPGSHFKDRSMSPMLKFSYRKLIMIS